LSLAATASLRGSPASTPPVLETKVKVRGWAGGAAAPGAVALSAPSAGAGPPRAGAAALASVAAWTRVPGAKKALRAAVCPVPAPARPTVGTTRATRTWVGRPYRETVRLFPAPAP